MLPPFNEYGLLPGGIHDCTIEEAEVRFGRFQESDRRPQLWAQFREFFREVQAASLIAAILLNGSFVTDAFEANDVDCVLLIGPGFPRDSAAETELLAGLPFLEINLVGQADFDMLVQQFFATDRHSRSKGMVEIVQ